MRGMYYFDHDNNAHNDTKIIRIKRKFGYEGYGVYWLLLEVLHANTGFVTNDILDDVAYQERIDDEWLEQFIDFCVSIDLFKRDGDLLYSERMLTDIQAFKQLGEKRRAAALSRYNRRTGDDQPDNRNIPQNNNAENNNTDADIAARAMEALNRKFEEAMAAAEQAQTTCTCTTNTNETQMQEDNSCTANDDDLQKQSNSNDNANSMQTDKQAECNCNANAEQVQTVCTAKKIKENKINKTTTNKNYQDTITLSDSDILDDITFPNPEESIMINDFDDVPEFDPPEQEEPPNNKQEFDELHTLLGSFGISAVKATELISSFDKNYIYSKIDLLRQQDNIQNAAAWLIQAIEHDWRPSVKQSAPQPTATQNKHAGLGGEDYEDFKREYKRIFNRAFADVNKPCYIKACFELNSPSLVIKLLRSIEEAGAEWYMRFATANKIESIEMLMQSRDLADKFYAAFSRDFPPQSISLGGYTA